MSRLLHKGLCNGIESDFSSCFYSFVTYLLHLAILLGVLLMRECFSQDALLLVTNDVVSQLILGGFHNLHGDEHHVRKKEICPTYYRFLLITRTATYADVRWMHLDPCAAQGLLDFTFSPAFNSNKYFYVSYTVKDDEVSTCWSQQYILLHHYWSLEAGPAMYVSFKATVLCLYLAGM